MGCRNYQLMRDIFVCVNDTTELYFHWKICIYFLFKTMNILDPYPNSTQLFWIHIYFFLWKCAFIDTVVLGIDPTDKSRVPFWRLQQCALEWTPIILFHISQTFKSKDKSAAAQLFKWFMLLCAQFACKMCKTLFIYCFFFIFWQQFWSVFWYR